LAHFADVPGDGSRKSVEGLRVRAGKNPVRGENVMSWEAVRDMREEGVTHKEPIAIIGVGCRFPGARGPEAYWELLRDGVDAIAEIPPDRFDVGEVYDPRPGMPGKINTKWGGFLEGADEVDPYFF
jgi:hypothetical protein